MARLTPVPLGVLARRAFRELERQGAIFDLSSRKFVLGDARHDCSVRFHDRVAATPFGPAAGPHTQLAQNIVLAWLAGGRIMELKTVQVRDDLEIPRPCIDMQTVGYNVEWSQELRVEQSLEEYAKAALLIRMLAASGRLALLPGMDRTIFDTSVGYDLAGIRSAKVQGFLRGMADATAVLGRLRREVPPELAALRDVEVDPRLSGTLTLSTFHGCPPDEIERIVESLLREHRFHCVVKLNPTLLGREELRALLRDRLGYHELKVPDDAFDRDTTWSQAEAIIGRLRERAAALGLGFGVKLTNTLVVENHRDIFPAAERVMYLSGPPLHVLAMHLVRRIRRTFGAGLPISFSAGIDRANFPDAVALGLVPVTVCSDLLKPGGYGRAHGYLAELGRRMDAVGAASIPQFIHACDARAQPQVGPPVVAPPASTPAALEAAVLRNTERYVERCTGDERYAAAQHQRGPRKIGRRLWLLDCVACDKCVAVCPNDAIFGYHLPGAAQPRQYAVVADLCNDCGNCDAFCPEDGGPYRLKPRLFTDRTRWAADAPRDAVLVEAGAITGRFDGAVHRVADGAGEGAADHPYDDILRRLHAALLAPTEVNHVNCAVDRID